MFLNQLYNYLRFFETISWLFYIFFVNMLTSFFQANAVRGIIAAVCCAAIFIIFGLLNKYRWRPPQDEIAVSYKKTDSHIKLAENKKEGADNPVFVD